MFITSKKDKPVTLDLLQSAFLKHVLSVLKTTVANKTDGLQQKKPFYPLLDALVSDAPGMLLTRDWWRSVFMSTARSPGDAALCFHLRKNVKPNLCGVKSFRVGFHRLPSNRYVLRGLCLDSFESKIKVTSVTMLFVRTKRSISCKSPHLSPQSSVGSRDFDSHFWEPTVSPLLWLSVFG